MGQLSTVMLEHVDHELTCCLVKSFNMESSPSSNSQSLSNWIPVAETLLTKS
jgi:hypothetical protein